MSFRKILMVGTMGGMLGVSANAFAECGDGSYKDFCMLQDVITAVSNYLLNASQKKLIAPTYDITKGLEKIKENIGEYQEQGKCGISATGNSGCTDEKNRAAAEGGAEAASALTEAGSAVLGGTKALIQLDVGEQNVVAGMSDLDKKYLEMLGHKDGDTFDKLRENVTNHVFETDEAAINAGCTCSAGSGASCSTIECAEKRQNDLLIRSSTVASATADSWLKDLKDKDVYRQLQETLQGLSRGGEISAFVGKMNNASYNASILAISQMALLTNDLRAQSYRNLMTSGTAKEDLANINGGN